jgi:hypothetical protein
LTALFTIATVALVLLLLSGLKTERDGRSNVEDLESGRLFANFEVDTFTLHIDKLLALDRKNRRVGFAKATYFSDRNGDRKHVAVTLAIDIHDIKSVRPIGWIGGKPACYLFGLRRPIPPENESNSLSISGNPNEIGAIADEIQSLLRDGT